MKTADLTTRAGCRVVIERAGITGVGVTITQPGGKKSDTFACRIDEAAAIGQALVDAASTNIPPGES